MKELFENAEVEVVKFAIEDIITTSGDIAGDDDTTGGNTGGGKGEDETEKDELF